MPLDILKHFLIIPSLFLFLIISGCATPGDTLTLDNVIQEEKDRKERQDIKAKAEKMAVETQAKVEAEKKSASSNLNKTPQEIIAKAKARPEELEFLEIPDFMIRLTSEELAQPAIQEKVQKIFPDLVAGWRVADSSVMLLSGLILMQPQQLLSMTKEQFLESVQKVKGKYDIFYEKQFKAPMTFDILEKGAMIYVRMTSKYLNEGEWWADERLIYFYKSDYRLNILVTGKEKDLTKVKIQTDEMIALFEQRLSQYFKDGIKFQEE